MLGEPGKFRDGTLTGVETTAIQPLRERLRAVLGAREPVRLTPQDRVPAAVLILVFERDGEPWIVFTRRTHEVKHHKGEISFPGGARDAEDADLRATALRETWEEIGLDPDAVDVVGEMDDFPTFVTNYLVTPVVGVIPPPEAYIHSEFEVGEVLELPVRELASGLRIEDWRERGRTHPMFFFEARGHTVWGVTGYILAAFLTITGEVFGVSLEGKG
jgi:8-oxo-dGTP pyrophosphatase MutT (NUDIX family)